MAPPQVKTPTEWPCESAALGEVVECPGTDDDNRVCKKLIQIRAGTNAEKPSFGKYFIMHSKDDGGCGYFSYVSFKEGEQKIGLEEPVYRRAKRKIATSEIPASDIDPTEQKKAKVEPACKQEQLDEMWKNIHDLKNQVYEVIALKEDLAGFQKDIEEMKNDIVGLKCQQLAHSHDLEYFRKEELRNKALGKF